MLQSIHDAVNTCLMSSKLQFYYINICINLILQEKARSVVVYVYAAIHTIVYY